MHRTHYLRRAAGPAGGGGNGGRRTAAQQQHQQRKHKLLLPPDTFLDRAAATMQGLWSHLTDASSSRQQYERWVEEEVIQDEVLEQAQHGHMLTMALFWNLQHPLWARHQFKAKEFVRAVGPALENFQETLAQLVMQMNRGDDVPTKVDGEQADGVGDSTKDQPLLDGQPQEDSKDHHADPLLALMGLPKMGTGAENKWRQQAQQDPDSLAAQLQKMASDPSFDEIYYGAKLYHALSTSSTASNLEYVPGSSVVQSVALLHARVAEVYDDDLIDTEHPEFAASEGTQKISVAARLDVLYEISQQYRSVPAEQRSAADSLSVATNYNMITNDAPAAVAAADDSASTGLDSSLPVPDKKDEKPALDAALADEDKSHNATVEKPKDPTATSHPMMSMKEDVADAATDDDAAAAAPAPKITPKEEMVTETTLAVAVLEGWLHGGPDNKLTWRVAAIRDAYEFS